MRKWAPETFINDGLFLAFPYSLPQSLPHAADAGKTDEQIKIYLVVMNQFELMPVLAESSSFYSFDAIGCRSTLNVLWHLRG